MKGKSKCKILKDIRRHIAAENGIEFITSECKYQGDCSGTCPKCEEEVRYLEAELKKRQKAGKAIAVAGIAATMLVGCGTPAVETTGPSNQTTTPSSEITSPSNETTQPTTETLPVPGEIIWETEPDGLMGDIPMPTEDEQVTKPTLPTDMEFMGAPPLPPEYEP